MNELTAEFIGTLLLILIGCGVNANVLLEKTKGNRLQDSGWMVISTGWAMAVYVGVVVAGPYSGAHINPAVTLGLAFAGEFSIHDAPSYLAAQFAGAFAGAFLVWLLYKSHFDATKDAGLVRGTFCTDPAIPNVVSNLFSELLGTFVLVFVVLYITPAKMADSGELVGLGSIGALPVAFLVWAIGMGLGGTTGYAINPARDLSPRLVHALFPIKGKTHSNWGYSWIPVIGPVLGGVLAAVAFQFLEGNLPF